MTQSTSRTPGPNVLPGPDERSLFVRLTKGYFAIVDVEDRKLVETHRWSASVRSHGVYATRNQRTNGKGRIVYLHKLILDAPMVDHKNGDTLDCRRHNLRSTDHSGNMINSKMRRTNTSGFRGVCRRSDCNRWSAFITADGKHRALGTFLTKESAAHAYDAAARELHGEFARLNFPDEEAA